MSRSAEQVLANELLAVLGGAWGALVVVWAVRKTRRPVEAPVVAAAMAYGFYVAAALFAGAKFPEFLREHLFDGLAPAAVVGLLVGSYRWDNPLAAFPWIRRPVLILFVVFVGSALIFGLIAAAAVFASGSNDFTGPVWTCAWRGGLIFTIGYFLVAGRAVAGWPARVQWWLSERPTTAATPHPNSPRPQPPPPARADPANSRPVSPGPAVELPALLTRLVRQYAIRQARRRSR